MGSCMSFTVRSIKHHVSSVCHMKKKLPLLCQGPSALNEEKAMFEVCHWVLG